MEENINTDETGSDQVNRSADRTDEAEVTYNVDQLRKSAVALARHQADRVGNVEIRPIRPHLQESRRILEEAYRLLSARVKTERDISPAAEWLIDNFYIIQEQLVQVATDFPAHYQKSIPAITRGEYKGLPRVYELMLNLVIQTDNVIAIETLVQYVKSYQEVENLKLGEVWAIPIMVRYVLLLQLTELSRRTLARKKKKEEIESLIGLIDPESGHDPGQQLDRLGEWFAETPGREKEELLIELYQSLQAAGLVRDEFKRWFVSQFYHLGTTLDDALHREAQRQSRFQVSIQNAVMSLRTLSEADWTETIESCSWMDQMLRLDPAGVYPEMDFETRDRYRRTIERISRRSSSSETEITELVLQLAEESREEESREEESDEDLPHRMRDNRKRLKRHVGYYLLGEGYDDLIRRTGYRMPLKERLQRMFERRPVGYLALIGLHTLVLLAILGVAIELLVERPALTAVTVLIAFFPALDLSVAAVNRFFAFFLPPRRLPRMDYEEKIPNESRTLVVVPTILGSVENLEKQLEALEIRALANPHSSLQFALLTDFADADEKHLEGDREVLEAARKRIEKMNLESQSRFGDRYFLLHRDRQWNESEGVWMGWERKRGKLEELNQLIQKPDRESGYRLIAGRFVESIRRQPVTFVITLDADTRLPPDGAVDLVSTAAHPLNRPWYNRQKRRITSGYGIIQPRISIPPDSARRSWFTIIFSGHVGLDPYSTAVSDIYQDLAGEAVFTGKGIYDVEAFEYVLRDRFPENRILSHDLIESTYLRAGLATDIELFDDFPSTCIAYFKRNHRWVRGDWQIAAWMFPRVPEKGGKVRNPLNLLSRWKIFDNLRRSLNPFFLMLFLLAGWYWLPGDGLIWTLAAFGILAFPIYVSLSTDLINRPAKVKWRLHLEKVRSNVRINSIQALSTLMFLPYLMLVNLDAIVRTLWRSHVSGKNRLEWSTAWQVEHAALNSFMAYLTSMAVPVLIAVLLPVAAIWTGTPSLWLVVPFSLLWVVSPVYAWWISQSRSLVEPELTDEQRKQIRAYARRTWFYFERFVTEEHSWLPPDNHQEKPHLSPVARTSPTNIGLALISLQSAYRMGYVTFGEYLQMTDRMLRSMDQLERHHGHFYNWYDTRLGEVLEPNYISTVDSGNLAAALMVAAQGLRDLVRKPGVNRQHCQGLQDTIRVIGDVFEESVSGRDEAGISVLEQVRSSLKKLKAGLAGQRPATLEASRSLLRSLLEEAEGLSSIDLTRLRHQIGDDRIDDLEFWLSRPLHQIRTFLEECRVYGDLDVPLDQPFSIEMLSKGNGMSANGQPDLRTVRRWIGKADELVGICERLIREMDFSFLYDTSRRLFRIGFDVSTSQPDRSTYDLLASEARIASYVAIAKGDVPAEHWFRLSRRLTSLRRNEILLSWGGTMFEYLMPLLFMRTYPHTLLDHTYHSVVRWQREYGERRGHPWGASESAYYFLNLEMHYQYKAFGVPGLGMKRGLAEEYVVAPYASMLALMVDPHSSLKNLKRIEQQGGLGVFGFYDSIDYTPSRLKKGEDGKVVRSYMVHHHGMSLLAMDNLLNGWVLHHYFHSDPRVRGCELLLQEKIPRGVPIKEPHPIDAELEPGEQKSVHAVVDHVPIGELDRTPPRTHILSNGRYSTMVTHAGTGYSAIGETLLTAWNPDPVCDADGLLFYVRDLDSGMFWSAGHQPVRRKPDRYDTWFHNDRVVTSRVDEWVETTVETTVSPEHNMELRKVILTNYSSRERTLELTSYAEVILNDLPSHLSHPAFSRLFLETDYLPEQHALLVRRRVRDPESASPGWVVHTITGLDFENLTEPLQYETDKWSFIGRGRTLARPAVMDPGSRLKGTLGHVTDPIVSLRRIIRLGPGEKVQFTFGLGWAKDREEALRLADYYQSRHASERTFELAAVYSRVEQSHVGLTSAEAHRYQRLLSQILYPANRDRPDDSLLEKNSKTQEALWPFGISGDLPILLYRMDDVDQIRTLSRLLKARLFWKRKGVHVDLVILNEHPPGYVDALQETIRDEMEQSVGFESEGAVESIYLMRASDLAPDDLILLKSVAALIIDRTWAGQETGPEKPDAESDSWLVNETRHPYRPAIETRDAPVGEPDMGAEPLLFDNGYGGFSESGDEYRIRIVREESGEHRFPPAPWSNLIANESFGFLVTERGGGYTWSRNSRENKLTSWSNEPVSDPHSEAIWLRDETAGEYWSVTPGPTPGAGNYRVDHGFGYSRFHSVQNGLSHELTLFADAGEPVKVARLKVRNDSDADGEYSVFSFVDRVMGVERRLSGRHVIPSVDSAGRVIYGVNRYNNEFAGRVAFHAVRPPTHAHAEIGVDARPVGDRSGGEIRYSTDRYHFVGRNRSMADPRALVFDMQMENRVGVSTEPCAAFQYRFRLKRGEEIEILFLTGESDSREEADRILGLFDDPEYADSSLERVIDGWQTRLGKVQVRLPDTGLEIMLNGWLLYQSICSRIWARTAFYQAGGAYGYRDQLQDVMAAYYADPGFTSHQIQLHAAHQFPEGDVPHWWHPPTGRGIRSRITDDRLWLPYVTAFYIESSGDGSILDHEEPFLMARPLEEGEHEAYLIPEKGEEMASVYEHCCRAIDISLSFGEHGLPLMGGGDWNDGMNHVGSGGKGESVWLGFFLYDILKKFAPLARERQDTERAERYEQQADRLRDSLNREGWDGEWYLRAYYDDGTPLGSGKNRECRIDAISQAWAVITGVADDGRTNQVLDALQTYLVREQDGLIRLLTPPFDKTERNPGYIKGYIPGVRENGGQYTHAALWAIQAFAVAGRGDLAVRYLDMINPVCHAQSREQADRYRVEPYVIAADVYGEAPLTGRGGWTWYTGSASWMYRVGLESILGFRFRNGEVQVNPSVSPEWKSYSVNLKIGRGETLLKVTVENPSGLTHGRLTGEFEGTELHDSGTGVQIPVSDDGQVHEVTLTLEHESAESAPEAGGSESEEREDD